MNAFVSLYFSPQLDSVSASAEGIRLIPYVAVAAGATVSVVAIIPNFCILKGAGQDRMRTPQRNGPLRHAVNRSER